MSAAPAKKQGHLIGKVPVTPLLLFVPRSGGTSWFFVQGPYGLGNQKNYKSQQAVRPPALPNGIRGGGKDSAGNLPLPEALGGRA